MNLITVKIIKIKTNQTKKKQKKSLNGRSQMENKNGDYTDQIQVKREFTNRKLPRMQHRETGR